MASRVKKSRNDAAGKGPNEVPPARASTPPIERLLGNLHLPAHLHHGHSYLDLLQNGPSLFHGKALSLQGKSLFLTSDFA